MKKIKQILKSEKGQGLTEYGLIIALISIACIIALGLLGKTIGGKFTEINNAMGGGGMGN